MSRFGIRLESSTIGRRVQKVCELVFSLATMQAFLTQIYHAAVEKIICEIKLVEEGLLT